jgi:hypothetical protein
LATAGRLWVATLFFKGAKNELDFEIETLIAVKNHRTHLGSFGFFASACNRLFLAVSLVVD